MRTPTAIPQMNPDESSATTSIFRICSNISMGTNEQDLLLLDVLQRVIPRGENCASISSDKYRLQQILKAHYRKRRNISRFARRGVTQGKYSNGPFTGPRTSTQRLVRPVVARSDYSSKRLVYRRHRSTLRFGETLANQAVRKIWGTVDKLADTTQYLFRSERKIHSANT